VATPVAPDDEDYSDPILDAGHSNSFPSHAQSHA
jgi:hypothetical protein